LFFRSKAIASYALVALASSALELVPSGPGARAEACNAKPAQKFLGKPYTEAIRDQAQAASGATIVEVLRNQGLTTLELRIDRLNILIDPKTNALVWLWCG
jgi:hypothetical protein